MSTQRTYTPEEVDKMLSTERQLHKEEMEEARTIIKDWAREFGIEPTWPDELHPADILDKYVFPVLTQKHQEERDFVIKRIHDGALHVILAKDWTLDQLNDLVSNLLSHPSSMKKKKR